MLITIFWLGRLAYSLEDYQGPLPELEAFETLINKTRPPEMVCIMHGTGGTVYKNILYSKTSNSYCVNRVKDSIQPGNIQLFII